MCDKKTFKEDPRLKYKIDIKKPIGTGEFSTVYHSVDKIGNEYAIKCISLSKLEKHNIEKFLLELEISMKLNHTNIVKATEVFKTSTNWYIVTEYCNGGTLCDVIKKLSKNYNERELICKRYLTQLKNALRYLHKNKIIHRDLKPNNILISGEYPNDTLKLADFGFSRYFNSEEIYNSTQQKDIDFDTKADTKVDTNMGVVGDVDIGTKSETKKQKVNFDNFMMTSFCGTPLYMAPELLTNRKYNNKSDLWSFGVIMYEMLYGCNPYNYPKNLSNLMELMKTQEIEFVEVYSKECLDLIKKLLETDPHKRIEWDEFFRHEWFDKNIPSGVSKESLRGSIENLTNLAEDYIFAMEDEQPSSKTQSPNSNLKRTYREIPIDHILSHINEVNDDFDIIDTSELAPCDYKSYKEEESNYGILRILSNSIRYFLPGSH
jgi:serine/threonine-protein kinase ULK/ATG1